MRGASCAAVLGVMCAAARCGGDGTFGRRQLLLPGGAWLLASPG